MPERGVIPRTEEANLMKFVRVCLQGQVVAIATFHRRNQFATHAVRILAADVVALRLVGSRRRTSADEQPAAVRAAGHAFTAGFIRLNIDLPRSPERARSAPGRRPVPALHWGSGPAPSRRS